MKTRGREFTDPGTWAQFTLGALLAIAAVWLYQLQHAEPRPVWPQGGRVWIAAALFVLWAGSSTIPFWRARRQRSAVAPIGDFIVAYASQTGFAEQLAVRTAADLQKAGRPAQAISLADLDADALRGRHVLFVVSTTGEGDAPDAAYRFVRRAMVAPATLADVRYGVLALGDRSYAQFCAFGHRLEHWLRLSGAQALFDLVEVDNGEAAALRHWQHHLRAFTGHAEIVDWRAPSYDVAPLVERVCLNPNGVGAPAFLLKLQAPQGTTWRAGDLVEIGPRNDEATIDRFLIETGVHHDAPVQGPAGLIALRDGLRDRLLPEAQTARDAVQGDDLGAWFATLPPLPHREYSIASLPTDGSLELLVRQMRDADGRLGLGSGWLTVHAPLHAPIALRVRSNRNFHLDDRGQPLILIGNGTGIAGLRAHLKARVLAGHRRNWLLFGERSAVSDYFFGGEIAAWQRDGWLAHVDLAFSRDQAQRVYVQERLAGQRERLRQWLADGATVLVCGSLDGMAPAVDAVIREALGEAGYDAFVESGRYRRDVY